MQHTRSSPSKKKVNEHFLPIFQLGKSVTVEENGVREEDFVHFKDPIEARLRYSLAIYAIFSTEEALRLGGLGS